jgi:hypothetical protein
MQCTVSLPGPPRVRLPDAHDPRAAQPTTTAPGCPERPCRQARDAGDCLAVRAARPILEAFSGIISHAAFPEAGDGGLETRALEETGQQAALRLLLAALRASGCPFFGDLLPAGIGWAEAGDCRVAFLRCVRGCIDRESGAGAEGDPQEPAAAVEARLAPLLGEARRRCRQDAALNAVIILINCVRLAQAEAEDDRLADHGAQAVRTDRIPPQ